MAPLYNLRLGPNLNGGVGEAVRIADTALIAAQRRGASPRVIRRRSSVAFAAARIELAWDSVGFMRVLGRDFEARGLVINLTA